MLTGVKELTGVYIYLKCLVVCSWYVLGLITSSRTKQEQIERDTKTMLKILKNSKNVRRG